MGPGLRRRCLLRCTVGQIRLSHDFEWNYEQSKYSHAISKTYYLKNLKHIFLFFLKSIYRLCNPLPLKFCLLKVYNNTDYLNNITTALCTDRFNYTKTIKCNSWLQFWLINNRTKNLSCEKLQIIINVSLRKLIYY